MLHNNSYSLPTRVKPSTSEYNILVQSQLGCDNQKRKKTCRQWSVCISIHSQVRLQNWMFVMPDPSHTHTSLARVSARARLKSQTSRTEKLLNISTTFHRLSPLPVDLHQPPGSMRYEQSVHTIADAPLTWTCYADESCQIYARAAQFSPLLVH